MRLLDAPTLAQHTDAVAAKLYDVYSGVREAAAGTLGAIDPETLRRHVPSLTILLEDPESEVRQIAEETLRRVMPAPESGAHSVGPTVRAIAGSRTILLGINALHEHMLAQCAGFAIRRVTVDGQSITSPADALGRALGRDAVWLSPRIGRPSTVSCDEALDWNHPGIAANLREPRRAASEGLRTRRSTPALNWSGAPIETFSDIETLCEVFVADGVQDPPAVLDDPLLIPPVNDRLGPMVAEPNRPFDPCLHPIRTFQWADHTVVPGTCYEYSIFFVRYLRDGEGGGERRMLESTSAVVRVAAEEESGHPDGIEVHFNQGAAASQTFARHFGEFGASVAEWEWLGRGLEAGLLRFIARAKGAGWGLHCAFSELSYNPILDALAQCRGAGTDLRVLCDCKPPRWNDDRKEWTDYGPTQMNEQSFRIAGMGDSAIRRAASRSSIMHSNFLVLLKDGEPRAVWTGSISMTTSNLFGPLNVGFVSFDHEVARRYSTYWERLIRDHTTTEFKQKNMREQPIMPTLSEHGAFAVFSPRGDDTPLRYYADLIRGARQAVFLSAAFGISSPIAEGLLHVPAGTLERSRGGVPVSTPPHDVPTYLLLDNPGRMASPHFVEAVRALPNGHVACGSHLQQGRRLSADLLAERLPQLTEQERRHILYLHAKVLLIDPLSEDPTVICGSANFSMASITQNDENMFVLRGSRARRTARIFLAEFMRVHAHFACREAANARWVADADGTEAVTEAGGNVGLLAAHEPPPQPVQQPAHGTDEDEGGVPAWVHRFFREGSKEQVVRELFGRIFR